MCAAPISHCCREWSREKIGCKPDRQAGDPLTRDPSNELRGPCATPALRRCRASGSPLADCRCRDCGDLVERGKSAKTAPNRRPELRIEPMCLVRFSGKMMGCVQGRSSVVEQRPFKPKVVGSIPTAPTNYPCGRWAVIKNARGQKGADSLDDPVRASIFGGTSDHRARERLSV